MSRFYSLLASSFCVVLLASCAGLLPQLPPVAPGQLFHCGYVNVRAPNSEGWRLKESSTKGMGFAKYGQASGETLGAQLLLFELPPTETPEEFVALIKQAIEDDTDPKRLQILEQSADYTNERGYPCVRHQALVIDKFARTSAITREQLVLEWYGVYCRHPVRTDRGFAAVYSHRGRGQYQRLRAEAQDFISGAQVP